jgi:LysM repeat protein
MLSSNSLSKLLNWRSMVAVLVALLALTGTLGTGATPASAQGCYPFHIVKPGENLYRIAVAANTSWQWLMAYNGIRNPNVIFVGQRICLPPVRAGVTVTPITVRTVTPRPSGPTPIPATPPASNIRLPAPGVFPTINLNTYFARIGDSLTITGINFPTNEKVNIYLGNLGAGYPATAVATATTGADGSLLTTITIPPSVGGFALVNAKIGVLVRGQVTGYFGFNFFNRRA